MYPRNVADRDSVTSFSEMEAWIQLKDSRDPDPFQDPSEGAERKSWDFETGAEAAADICGQVASYAAAHMASRLRLRSHFSSLVLMQDSFVGTGQRRS